jgi:hypothetical protein
MGSRIFSFPRRPDRLWGPPNLLSNGYQGSISPGVERSGLEADHSPPASAEVKTYTSTPPYVFMVQLVEHRDNFTFTFRLYCSLLGCDSVDWRVAANTSPASLG